MQNLGHPGNLHAIPDSSSSPFAQPKNPYRAILRRDYPEPLIALLIFILGIWLWDHYFSQPSGYAPGTGEAALVKTDRDLRLADVMRGDPDWLRWIAGVEQPDDARHTAIHNLHNLAQAGMLPDDGIAALAVIQAVNDNTLLPSVDESLPNAENPKSTRPANWWSAKSLERIDPAAFGPWKKAYERESQTLRFRALVTRSAVLVLGLVGVACLPRALRKLAAGFQIPTPGYGRAWTIPLGLVVFLSATLAWIGFALALEVGISVLPNPHPAYVILLDTAARLLPALIAIGFLFRRLSHAARILGLGKKIHIGSVLAVFSILMLLDLSLRLLIKTHDEADPAGGLSMNEAGWWGLMFTMISACIAAPISEEILYRGVLFQSLRNRLGLTAAALLSSMVFAGLHFYDSYGLASVAVFGFACAILYAGTGSLAAVITLHVLYNTSIKLPEWLIYHQPLG